VVVIDLRKGTVPPVLCECDVIIHLAGAPIAHRWTKSYKQLILNSRIQTAQAMWDFLSKSKKRPKIFISASATGFYGDRGDELLDESGAAGNDFLSSVCVEWEKAANAFAALGMRVVSVRTAAVLGPHGGILTKMIPLFRKGLGGKLGTGAQWFPWIHRDDLVNVYAQAVVDSRFVGPVNAVAPGLVRNIEFTKALGDVLRKPTIFPVPAFALRLCLGEFAEALLNSQRVIPKKLERFEFDFLYPEIQEALRQIFLA